MRITVKKAKNKQKIDLNFASLCFASKQKLAETPQPPPRTPAFGLIYEGGYRSAKIDDISCWEKSPQSIRLHKDSMLCAAIFRTKTSTKCVVLLFSV